MSVHVPNWVCALTYVDDELSLVRVDKETKEHVDNSNEQLGKSHSFPEVHRSTHLRHKFNENHSAKRISPYIPQHHRSRCLRATIGIHNLHDAIKLRDKRLISEGYRLNWAIWNTNRFRCLIVWSGMCNCPHCHNQGNDIKPYGKVSNRAELFQGSDLPEEHACQGSSEKYIMTGSTRTGQSPNNVADTETKLCTK